MLTWYFRNRFLVLLAALGLLVLAHPVLAGGGAAPTAFTLFYTLFLLAATATTLDRRQRHMALLLAVFALACHWWSFLLPQDQRALFRQLDYWSSTLFLVFLSGFILSILATQREVSRDVICGAICGYLFLGLFWGFLYEAVALFWPGSFAASGALAPQLADEQGRRSILLYFSFSTLTTLGYGDVLPVSPPARMLACMEVMAGQFYLSILVAGLVSLRIASLLQAKE
jgi:hypothetical protein